MSNGPRVIWQTPTWALKLIDDPPRVVAVISDYTWFLNCETLPQWLQDHNVSRTGMILTFPDQQTADWFTLTWL